MGVLFYTSAHGLGHAVRTMEVARALSAMGISSVIKGTAPGWLLRMYGLDGRTLKGDGGVAQKGLDIDLRATLEELASFRASTEGLIAREVASGGGIDLVVGDIPPLAFEVSSRLGVPGIALGNFSWDWVYASYAIRNPAFHTHAQEAAESYRKADLLLRLPFSCPMEAFRRVEDIPLIVGRPTLGKGEVLERLGVKAGRRTILISFGPGVEVGYKYLENLPYLFLVMGLGWSRGNVIGVARDFLPHWELVNACDAVVTKPGYGIAAECVSLGKPLLYASRDFPEEGAILSEARRYIPVVQIPRPELAEGSLGPYLEGALIGRVRPGPPTDGAERAAELIRKFL